MFLLFIFSGNYLKYIIKLILCFTLMLRKIHQQAIQAWSYLCEYKVVVLFKHFIYFIQNFQIYWLRIIHNIPLLFLKSVKRIEPIIFIFSFLILVIYAFLSFCFFLIDIAKGLSILLVLKINFAPLDFPQCIKKKSISLCSFLL